MKSAGFKPHYILRTMSSNNSSLEICVQAHISNSSGESRQSNEQTPYDSQDLGHIAKGEENKEKNTRKNHKAENSAL